MRQGHNSLFLTLLGCALLSCVVVFLFPKLKRAIALTIVALIVVASFGFIAHQIVNRPFHFSRHVTWAKSEEESLKIQKKILGRRLFKIMKTADDHLPLWF